MEVSHPRHQFGWQLKLMSYNCIKLIDMRFPTAQTPGASFGCPDDEVTHKKVTNSPRVFVTGWHMFNIYFLPFADHSNKNYYAGSSLCMQSRADQTSH